MEEKKRLNVNIKHTQNNQKNSNESRIVHFPKSKKNKINFKILFLLKNSIEDFIKKIVSIEFNSYYFFILLIHIFNLFLVEYDF